MKQSSTQSPKQQLTSQNNTENNHSKDYLTETKKIEGTPFILRRIDEKWFTTCGDIRLTEWTLTEEEQFEQLENNKWDIILTLIAYSYEKFETLKTK